MGLSVGYIVFTAVHFLCFALAIAVCGLYGQNISKDDDNTSKWIFAVVVGALSAVTCIAYSIPLVVRAGGIFKTAWDFVLFILWTAVFGLFANMYLHKENKDGDSGLRRMKNAVWVDLVNMILWFIVMLASAAYWFKNRDKRSQWTGRARV